MDSTHSARTAPLSSPILVANRGEIACRVIRTLRRLGITSVAVYSDADADALHTRLADVAVRIGPAEATASYLDGEAVVEAARRTGAQAIHPGYGFLSENPELARACDDAGIVFIGPQAETMQLMGDKIAAKQHVAAAGVPVADGVSEPGLSDEQLIEAVAGMAYPLLIKPAAGGGGKGMHAVERAEDLPETLAAARRVARSSFGSDELLIEELIRSPRHIEVQVLADAYGTVLHLGERECSLQRRHQKVIEEAPSALLDPETRERICQAACETARSVGYRGAGTVEFLVSQENPTAFSFMEMNTRLQVEHPVTEEVTGVDLVEQQIRIASGLPLQLSQRDIRLRGHAVEARVYAEAPEAGFLPSSGRICALREPDLPGVRVDSGIAAGTVVGTEYDPMLSKIVAWGDDRRTAFARLHAALAQTAVLGLDTNLPFLQRLTTDDDVLAGRMTTTTIEQKLTDLLPEGPDESIAVVTAAWLGTDASADAAGTVEQRDDGPGPLTQPRERSAGPRGWRRDGWRSTGTVPPEVLVQWSPVNPQTAPATWSVPIDAAHLAVGPALASPGGGADLRAEMDGVTRHVVLARGQDGPFGQRVWVRSGDFAGMVTVLDRRAQTAQHLSQLEAAQLTAVPEVTAPLPGTVVAIGVASGDAVSAGQVLVTIEAMKMEHRLSAPLDGRARLCVDLGDTVSRGQLVATVETSDAEANDLEASDEEN